MATLQDYYNTGDNNFQSSRVGYDFWQTFTTSRKYLLSSVKLLLFRANNPGTITIEIKATSSGIPTGSALTSGTFNANTLGTSTAGTWTEIQLTPYILSPLTKYAIVMVPSTGDPNYTQWKIDSSSPTYTGGNDGCNTEANVNDFMFETWGDSFLTFGEYLGAGSGTTKLLLHLNGNSTDSSGNGNNGTDTNITYSQANGKFGQGAGFNGSSSQVQIPYTASLQPTNITFSAWVKVGTMVQYGNILSKPYRATGWEAPYRSYGFLQGKNPTVGCFDCYISIGSTGYVITTADGYVTTGIWYNLIGTYDGTTFKFYINGALYGQTNASGTIGYKTNEPLMLGQRSSSSAGEYYNGAIDEVIIENRAWSASEIKKYYTNSLGRF